MSKQAELEERLSEVASVAITWKGLLEHPGWKLFEQIMREQMNLRQQTCMLTPIGSEYSAMAQEFFKGEFSGIGTALATPQAQYDIAETERRTLTKEMELDDDSQERERQVDAAFASRFDGDPFGE